MSRVDAKLSKLDRFIACDDFLAAFPSLSATAHPQELSEHFPITLISTESDYGPPPFKFFNSWILIEGFEKLVTDAWLRFEGYGNAHKYLAAKFKFLKNEIIRWKLETRKEEEWESITIKTNIAHIEKESESHNLTTDELQSRACGLQRLQEIEKMVTLDLKQKAHIEWSIDVTKNLSFSMGT